MYLKAESCVHCLVLHGVVAAGNPHTARAGAEALRKGGNAVDAVVAGTLASFLSEPLLASAGGAGMLILSLPGQEPAAIDFFSNAPGLGPGPPTPADSTSEAVDPDFVGIDVSFGPASQVFHVGRASAAAPRAFPGLALAAARFGRLSLADLTAPAIHLAREGVELTPQSAEVFRLLWAIQEVSPETMALYSSDGQPPPAGSSLYNPEFAELLSEFAAEGATPRRMREGLQAHFGPNSGGGLHPADLAALDAVVTPPRRFHIGDWEILGSPRLGGALIEVILRHLDHPVGAEPLPDETEAAAILQLARGSLAGHQARCSPGTGSIAGCTTHLSVFDADGGVASVTLTNGEGCGHLLPGTGIQLNNFLGEEDLNPHGFHQHAPGDPLPTMLAPTIVLREGTPRLALGSGGSNRIRSAVSSVLYRVMHGEDLKTAIHAPRVHAEDDSVWVELAGLKNPTATKSALAGEFELIYAFPERAFFFGGVNAVQRLDDGRLIAIGDPRRGGTTETV